MFSQKGSDIKNLFASCNVEQWLEREGSSIICGLTEQGIHMSLFGGCTNDQKLCHWRNGLLRVWL